MPADHAAVPPTRRRLVLLGRSYCHLCTELAEALQAHLQGRPIQVDWLDLDEAEHLEERFGEHIPVLFGDAAPSQPGSVEICRHRFDPVALDAFMARIG